MIFYTHPANLVGEIPGKGSNIHYAESEFKKYAIDPGWPEDIKEYVILIEFSREQLLLKNINMIINLKRNKLIN